MTADRLELSVSVRPFSFWFWGKAISVDALLDGRRVSGACVTRPYRFMPGLDTWWVMNLGTHRSHRRRGFGRRVVEACLAAARGEGIDTLYAAADARNEPSVALFESVGFDRIGDSQLAAAIARAHKWPLCRPPEVAVFASRTAHSPEELPS